MPSTGFHSYLSLVCMSALLEHGGEATWGELTDTLRDIGVVPDRAHGAFKKSLQTTGRVEIEDGLVTATGDGMQFVAENTGYIEDSYQKIGEKKLKFAPIKYMLLSHIESSASADDGWLYHPSNQTSVIKLLCDKFDFSRRNMARNLYDYHDGGFVEQMRFGDDNTITNLKLTEKGETELGRLRKQFPDEIACLEAQWTIEAMREEIDNMLWELDDEEPAGPENLKTLGKEALDAEIQRLESTMSVLMDRIDARAQLSKETQVQ